MAIVMLVSDGYGGYGDFLFGLKMLSGIKKSLREFSEDIPIYLVTQKSGKDKIVSLEADTEFNIQVKSFEEFHDLKNTPGFTLSCFIEGPIFNPVQRITIPKNTPVVLVPEYSISPTETDMKAVLLSAKKFFNNPLRWKLECIQSGFELDKKSHSLFKKVFDKFGQGFLFTDELVKIAAGEEHNFSYRTNYWYELKNYSSQILLDLSIEDYHHKTDLSFEYSRNKKKEIGIYHRNHCKLYLEVHSLFSRQSSKNQDIISVGKNREAKINALTEILTVLQYDGYNRIEFITLESGDIKVLHDETGSTQKIYRFFHAKNLKHREMIAIMALSGDLVGVTGDQSFAEALSSEKFVVYESRSHKKLLANRYIDICNRLDKHGRASDLVSLLIKGNIDSKTGDPAQRARLEELLSDPMVTRRYKTICRKIHQEYDLVANIVKVVRPIIVPDVDEPSAHLRKYLSSLVEGNIEKFKNLVQENPVDFIETTQEGMILIKHMIYTRNFVFLETVLSTISHNNADLSPILDAIRDLWVPGMALEPNEYYNKKCPILYNAALIWGLQRVYRIILSEQSERSTKRNSQRGFLSDVLGTINYKDDSTESLGALIGALLLVRKSIRQESSFWHNSALLKSIESHLKNVRHRDKNAKKNAEKTAFNELKNYLERRPEIFEKSLTSPGFGEFFRDELGLGKSNKITPADLTQDDIASYRKIVSNRTRNERYILKVSRKDPQLTRVGLQFSILRYPKDSGFYVLSHGEGAVLGTGGWGKVKLAYYVDGKGVMNPNPLAIKIERNKRVSIADNEISLFQLAHPSPERHLYRRGSRLESRKHYSILPKLPGIPLSTYLAQKPTLSDQERLFIAITVMKNVCDLHGKGIAHLDLKPDNILYSSEKGQVNLIDFGSSEKNGKKIKFENINTVQCTIEYMPPEYFRDDCRVDDKLDIYACGMVLGQIMGMPLVDLVRDRLIDALSVFQSPPIKEAIIKRFQKTNSLEATVFSLQPFVYSDPNFNNFIEKFCNSSDQIKFSCGNEELNSILTSMVRKNPEDRPSADQIQAHLQKLVIPDTEPKQDIVPHE